MVDAAVSDFNKLTLSLLAQLPATIPKHSIKIQAFTVAFHHAIQSEPEKPIALFAADWLIAKTSAPEGKEDDGKFAVEQRLLFQSGGELLGLSGDIQSEWKLLSPVSQNSLLLYIQQLAELADIWKAAKDLQKQQKVDMKGLQEKAMPLILAAMTGDFSQVGGEAQVLVESMKNAIQAKEKERGRPFDILCNPRDREEFHKLMEELNQQNRAQVAKVSSSLKL